MTKQDYIAYWKISADKSWKASEHLFEKSDYVESLFFAHLALEKILKAHWIKDNSIDFPPRTHNLRRLSEETHLVLLPEQITFMEQMNTFQMEGRYPDYLFAVYKAFNQTATKLVLTEAEFFYQWLHNSLP